MSELKQLLLDNKINRFEYDAYVLFELDELGRIFLANKIEALFLDPAEGMQIEHPYTFHFGKMSEWRDIKLAIVKINQMLREVQDDRRSNFGGINEPTSNVSPYGTIPFGDRD